MWHRRFGHIGLDATKAALTKDYVKGVTFKGPFLRDHCVTCIVGKSPQHSYSHHGHHTVKVGELLHMDLLLNLTQLEQLSLNLNIKLYKYKLPRTINYGNISYNNVKI